MKEKYKFLGILALSIAVIAGAYALYNSYGNKILEEKDSLTVESSSETKENEVAAEKVIAPDFEVVDKDGNIVKLSDFKGKPVVINFWATWCGFCVDEMPEFDEVYSEVKDDVVFMMINATDGVRETVEKAKEYVDKEGYSFPVYYDTNQEAGSAYGVSSLPTTIFIDSEGYAVTGAMGAISKDVLKKGIGYIMPTED